MSKNLFDLSGNIALLTGSSRGIGKHLARGLAEAGATVIINGLNERTVEECVAEFRDNGLDAVGKAFDVTDSSAIDAAIADLESSSVPIDILVNNAGIQRRTPLLECDDATWEEVMNCNLASVFRVSRAVARHMVDRKRGKIINTCSIQSELGRPTIAPYAASKGGVKMLTKNMCAEWAPFNVQVNGLGPGYFATELTAALVEDDAFSEWLCKRTPAGRWGEVEELIGAAVFLASPASSFVNGHILYVDGGMSAVV
ncbi:MAG: SDR family oxidoreductase [Granulosicoccus sp.]|nr:SDR family oxidoreductase [Granulosicoccus sp.]